MQSLFRKLIIKAKLTAHTFNPGTPAHKSRGCFFAAISLIFTIFILP